MAGYRSVEFFEALNEGFDALVDAARAANDRAYRVAAYVVEEAQEQQRDLADVTKAWARAPFDSRGFLGAAFDGAAKTQGRLNDVARQLLGELGDVQKEGHDVLQRVLAANLAEARALVGLAREILPKQTESIQTASAIPRADRVRTSYAIARSEET